MKQNTLLALPLALIGAYFILKNKDNLGDTLGEAGKTVFDTINEAIEYWSGNLGIDAALIKAVIRTESNFDANAVGLDGEIGLMQLMPDTAAYYGVVGENLYSPYENIKAGASFLKEMIDKYGLEKGIQAYNLGETKLRKGYTSPTYLSKVLAFYDQYRGVA